MDIKIFIFYRYLFLFILILSISFLNEATASDIKGKVKSSLLLKDVNTESLNKIEKQKFSSSFLVSHTGDVANVIIYLESIKPITPFSLENYKFRMDMQERKFVPNVMAVIKGSDVTIANMDNFFHNVHAIQENKNLFIDNLAKFKEERIYRFNEKGVVSIKCEAHLEMLAHILVLDNPYFSKTDKDGVFLISNIPPGEYYLTAWHELMGEKKKKIIIKDGVTQEINFTFNQITEMNRIIDNN